MVAPRDISDQPSAIDPLVLLPLPKHLPAPPTEDLQVLVSAFHDVLNGRSSIPISVLTSQLRLVTRNSHALLNASRSGTAEMRFELDNVDTELRGVEYELNRVREEIAKCEDYSDLDIPDVETFKSTASPDVLASLPPDDDEGYENALTIARLEKELADVEERQETVARLTKERDAIIRSNKEIKMKFATTDTYLTDYARSTTIIARKVSEIVAQPAAPSTS